MEVALDGLTAAGTIPFHRAAPAAGSVIGNLRKTVLGIRVCAPGNSQDQTEGVAEAQGATVVTESLRCEGSAIHRTFPDTDVDVHSMVDSAGAWEAALVPKSVQVVLNDHSNRGAGCCQDDPNDLTHRVERAARDRAFDRVASASSASWRRTCFRDPRCLQQGL